MHDDSSGLSHSGEIKDVAVQTKTNAEFYDALLHLVAELKDLIKEEMIRFRELGNEEAD